MSTNNLSTGRRKTAIARVYLVEGKGTITVNERPSAEYFPRLILQKSVKEPLELANMLDKFDIHVTVRGGGLSGQADAIKLGISRALLKLDDKLRIKLKRAGCLRRDSRQKERKKYGQKGARARFQFSKR
ncbi:MAG: 30S ribosomal protein S9 [bacterium]